MILSFSVFKNKIFFLFLTITSFLCISSKSYAQGAGAKKAKIHTNCTTCLNEIDWETSTIQCSDGHHTERDCLNYEIKSTADILRLKCDGLRCNGLDGNGSRCDKVHPFDEIRKMLSELQLNEVVQRIAKVEKPSEDKLSQGLTNKLIEGIEEAFTLCCPQQGCGTFLDQIEGCNAAKCSNQKCQTTFCYLCLKPQKGIPPQTDSEAAHAHVRGHSDNYWEMRKGFTDRYHWIIARNKLAQIFKENGDHSVMGDALNSRMALLSERNMWPFPAGKTTQKWLAEVQANTQLSPTKRIELLQNEYIYQKQVQDVDSEVTQLIEGEIKKLGAPVLSSLDVRDGPKASVAPVEANDPRVINLQGFVVLGNMYEIPGLGILSGSSPTEMTWDEAVGGNGNLGFCEERGGRMLTRAEWELVAIAMGKGTPAGYQQNMIPDMARRAFWSSELLGYDTGLLFGGGNGKINSDFRIYSYHVRCFVAL